MIAQFSFETSGCSERPRFRRALLAAWIASAVVAPLVGAAASAATSSARPPAAASTAMITNADFESGTLAGWNDWRMKRAKITSVAQAGRYAVVLGPERARCTQQVKIRGNSRYRLSAWVKTDSGSDQVELIAADFGGPAVSAASALTEYTRIAVEFTSAYAAESVLITLSHPAGPGSGYVDSLELEYLGEAPPPAVQEFVPYSVPERKTSAGVAQLPLTDIQWFLDAKFGLFIHWGVYSAIDKGNEWVMHKTAYPPAVYRARAEDPNTGFTAARFDPAAWAELAKNAGMKYTVLTSRHHDGYALFDSKHPNSWTSVQHLRRDLIKEYTDAVRKAGLHVGLYYSPMSWRYPGLYNADGKRIRPNPWGYQAEPGQKENARLMKEEVFEQLGVLLTRYGPIEYMFWDGAWLGETIDKDLEQRFWNPGQYHDPNNEWPVPEQYLEREPGTNQALGVMGMVRKHQPKMVVNERFSWLGDVGASEGSAATTGPIRTDRVMEKCVSLQKGGWGYVPNARVFSFEEVAVFLSDCVVRNMNLLLNVAPDREGVIPQNQQDVLRQTGAWLAKVGPAIYGTRGGPWQPLHGEYGFTYRGDKIYCHIYTHYRDQPQRTFTTQSLGAKRVVKVTDLHSGRALAWKPNADRTITIEGVDYLATPYVTILEITLAEDVYAQNAGR